MLLYPKLVARGGQRVDLAPHVTLEVFEFSACSLAQFTEEIAAANQGSVTGGALRDRTAIGRTLAIEVLEYFDRIKFTRRAGNVHYVLRPARSALGDG